MQFKPKSAKRGLSNEFNFLDNQQSQTAIILFPHLYLLLNP